MRECRLYFADNERSPEGEPHSMCASQGCWTELERAVPGSENTNPLNIFYTNPIRNGLGSLEKESVVKIKVLIHSLESAIPGQWGWGKRQEGTGHEAMQGCVTERASALWWAMGGTASQVCPLACEATRRGMGYKEKSYPGTPWKGQKRGVSLPSYLPLFGSCWPKCVPLGINILTCPSYIKWPHHLLEMPVPPTWCTMFHPSLEWQEEPKTLGDWSLARARVCVSVCVWVSIVERWGVKKASETSD